MDYDEAAYKRLFDKAILADNGCFIFTGHLNKDGYGWIYYKPRYTYAHRVAYILCVADIPGELQVLHTCDNPACVNPDHLFLGTPQNNADDKMAKGRHRCPKGSEHGAAKLTEHGVQEIKSRLASGETKASIARQYNVTWMTIKYIEQGITWRHVL